MGLCTAIINNANSTNIRHMSTEEQISIWQACKATFRPCTKDLLSDYVDPAEECHMELKPDNEKSRALKQHKRQSSNMTDITEEITDFSFLEEIFELPMSCNGSGMLNQVY